MSYKLPSTHIYQLLENSGGAANTTPDLSAVIIGTLMNLVDIDIDKASQIKSKLKVRYITIRGPMFSLASFLRIFLYIFQTVTFSDIISYVYIIFMYIFSLDRRIEMYAPIWIFI